MLHPASGAAARAIAVLLALGGLGGCLAQDLEGEPVASFELVGTLDENTCGSLAVNVPDPWTRTARLSKTKDGLFLWTEASGVVSTGSQTTSGEYRFRGVSTSQLIESTQTQPGCQVRLDDDLRFTLSGDLAADGGAQAGADAGAGLTLTGTQTTVITIVSGSDCTRALNGHGGNFLKLPCQFAYELEGDGTPH
jgi:hypothetical protein